MLYDNGALLALYADAAVATGDTFFAHIAATTADWTIREMQAAEGGYYSSYDADSEGHEGKFYVWDKEAVRQALTEAQYAVFSPALWAGSRSLTSKSHWHLHVFQSEEDIAESLGHTLEEVA